MSIQIDELNDAIRNALEEYNEGVIDKLKSSTKKAMVDLVKQTKSTAPTGNRSKHYKENISSKTLSETDFGITKMWYVKGSDYRLSHLLNNGHALRDGGRYAGTNFIGKAVDKVVEEYLKQVEEALLND